MAAACLIVFAARGMSQEPLLVEEIPAPMAVVEGLQNDIKRLEKEIEALRTERSLPDSENLTMKPTHKAADKTGDTNDQTLFDRLSTFEKGLATLVDDNDKKKREDEKNLR